MVAKRILFGSAGDLVAGGFPLRNNRKAACAGGYSERAVVRQNNHWFLRLASPTDGGCQVNRIQCLYQRRERLGGPLHNAV